MFPSNLDPNDPEAHFLLIDGLLRDWLHLRPSPTRVPLDPDVPTHLATFHRRFGSTIPQWCHQNRLVGPGELHPAASRTVFAIENQGVYEWAAGATPQDTTVWGRFEDADPWAPEEPTLSAFLAQFTLVELILGSSIGASAAALPESEAIELLGADVEFGLGSWRWPAYPTRFYHLGPALAMTAPNGPGYVSCWFAAPSPRDLEFLRPHLTTAWERVPDSAG